MSDHVGQVREVAQVVLEGADEAGVRVVGQVAVQVRVEVRLHKVNRMLRVSSPTGRSPASFLRGCPRKGNAQRRFKSRNVRDTTVTHLRGIVWRVVR